MQEMTKTILLILLVHSILLCFLAEYVGRANDNISSLATDIITLNQLLARHR